MSNEHYPTNPFKDYESGGIALAGCLLIGLGAGLFVKPLWLGLLAGAVIGLGVGLLAMAWMSRDR
jgi:hypothetical protein